MKGKLARIQGFLSGILACSLITTLVLLALDGNIRDALPLHLCGLSALAALALGLGAGGIALNFLWYLGMPGALLALLFPAPALSRYQALLNISYVVTHALILILPVLSMATGRMPRAHFAADMMILLQMIAVPVFFVNRALGTDFMFLSAPPANTPLETVFSWGYGAYLMCLEGIMLAVCLVMGAALEFIIRRKKRPIRE